MLGRLEATKNLIVKEVQSEKTKTPRWPVFYPRWVLIQKMLSRERQKIVKFWGNFYLTIFFFSYPLSKCKHKLKLSTFFVRNSQTVLQALKRIWRGKHFWCQDKKEQNRGYEEKVRSLFWGFQISSPSTSVSDSHSTDSAKPVHNRHTWLVMGSSPKTSEQWEGLLENVCRARATL